MDFTLTEEQRLVQETARNFATKELKPVAARLDHDGTFPETQVKALSRLGLMGVFVPPEYGGAGMDMISYVVALEEISKVWAALGTIMSVNNSLLCGALLRFGNESQKKQHLARLAKGEWLGCYALTEAASGSDAGALQSVARRDGSDYVLNGSKVFTTNGSRADLALVYALTDSAQGKQGISAFVVETKTAGFNVTRLEDKLGLRSSDTAALRFENCRVPAANRLGAEGQGFKIALATLDGGRIGIAAQALGIAQGCLDEALGYVCERRQFGKALREFGAIQAMLADMAVELDAARALTYRAAWQCAQGHNVTRSAAMAKLYASEACNRIAYRALQIFGGYGYIKEFPVERFYRDARVTTLYEGTSEIQRLIIARSLIAEGEPFRGAQEKVV